MARPSFFEHPRERKNLSECIMRRSSKPLMVSRPSRNSSLRPERRLRCTMMIRWEFSRSVELSAKSNANRGGSVFDQSLDELRSFASKVFGVNAQFLDSFSPRSGGLNLDRPFKGNDILDSPNA